MSVLARTSGRHRGPSPARPRPPVAVLAVALGCLLVLTALAAHAAAPSPAAAPLSRLPAVAPTATAVTPSPPSPWVGVIDGLARQRAEAFARGDLGELREVYAAHSRTGTGDVAVLRSLVAHDRHVRGLSARVVAAVVVAASGSRAVVDASDEWTAYDVVDRSGHVVGHGVGRPLHTLRFVLVRDGAHWRVLSVLLRS